jgi:hypothetical protein
VVRRELGGIAVRPRRLAERTLATHVRASKTAGSGQRLRPVREGRAQSQRRDRPGPRGRSSGRPPDRGEGPAGQLRASPGRLGSPPGALRGSRAVPGPRGRETAGLPARALRAAHTEARPSPRRGRSQRARVLAQGPPPRDTPAPRAAARGASRAGRRARSNLRLGRRLRMRAHLPPRLGSVGRARSARPLRTRPTAPLHAPPASGTRPSLAARAPVPRPEGGERRHSRTSRG